MITFSSARTRPALVACAAFSAALLLVPRTASAAGHGGGGGGGGSHGGGGGHSGGSSHSGGVSHSGGAHGVGGSRTGAFHGGGFHGGGFHGGGFRRYGWGYYPWGWGWGWGPWWWWSSPGVYVETGDDAYDDTDGSVGVSARTGRYAIVKTDVTPEEALVFLDGKYIGTADDFDGTPDYLYLGPGKFHIEFRLPGYQTFATDLDVSRGQRVRLDQRLRLEPGRSALDQFPPESRGTPLGRVFTKHGGEGGPEAGGPEAEEEAPPPPRRVPQRAPRDDGWSDRGMAPAPRVAPDEQMEVRPEPLPRPVGNRARMRFRVTPEDAAVYVDDKYLGAGGDLAANPRGVVTGPGTHSITVTRPGYKTKTVDITVRIGAPVDVVVDLEK